MDFSDFSNYPSLNDILSSIGAGDTNALGTGGFTFTDPTTGETTNVDPSGGGVYGGLGYVGGLPVSDIAAGSSGNPLVPVDYQTAAGNQGVNYSQSQTAPGGGTIGGGSGGTTKGTNGLLTNADGSINWPSLLGMLAPLLSGAYTSSQTGKATQQMLNAINNANSTITSTLGGNPALYQPYRDVGSVGLSRLTSMPQSNLAQQFQPLGTPGMSLNTVARGK